MLECFLSCNGWTMLAKKKEGTVLYPSRDMPRLKFVMGAFRRGARVNKRAHPFVFFFFFRFLCVCFFSVLLSLLCRVSRLSTRPGACVFFPSWPRARLWHCCGYGLIIRTCSNNSTVWRNMCSKCIIVRFCRSTFCRFRVLSTRQSVCVAPKLPPRAFRSVSNALLNSPVPGSAIVFVLRQINSWDPCL